jgi:bis(5'-nucleosyl)-tetraphosphatase (symmetrical)
LRGARRRETRRKRDTLEAVLAAPDRDELLEWLRHRPLMHREGALSWCMRDLLPNGRRSARTLSRRVWSALRADDFVTFLERMYGDEPRRWDDSLEGVERCA